MAKRTPFFELHQKANAKMVDFAGWEMPLHYGSQLNEHHKVRQKAGMFDVSHMGVVDVTGADVKPYLRYLLANNIDKITPGKAIYSCMLNEQAGVIDDLIVYEINDGLFRVVINAGTREKDLIWMQQQAALFDVTLKERTDLAMLAVQGPEVKTIIARFLPPSKADKLLSLKPFEFLETGGWFIARTGYTGEDGFEVIFPAKDASNLWQMLKLAGVAPCGLGARDTLRLEAGLNLYGQDMTESVTPYESNLGWTVALTPEDRNFIGRAALETQKAEGVKACLVGLVLDGPGIIRNHQPVMIEGNGRGEVTSGGYSPTLEKSIALARVPAHIGERCFVEIRHKSIPALVIKPPFVRHGKKMF